MSARDDGGPAFPCVVPNPETHPHGYIVPGMTLRDWFAGQALAGMYAGADGSEDEQAARSAYRIADAMLAERAKEAE